MEVSVGPLGESVGTWPPLAGQLCAHVAPGIVESFRVAATGLGLAAIVPVGVGQVVLCNFAVPFKPKRDCLSRSVPYIVDLKILTSSQDHDEDGIGIPICIGNR